MKLKYIERNSDRHGNVRYYVRKGKHYLGRLTSAPGTPEFIAEYQKLLAGTGAKTPPRGGAGSLAHLCQQYFTAADFAALSERTRYVRRGILDRICKKYGTGLVKDLELRHVRAWRDERAATPEGANSDIKALRQLLAWAVDKGLAASNPAAGVGYLRSLNPDGFYDWTEEEIEAYESRHPIGTRARLALDLMLYTGVRRSDAILLGPQNERAGALHFTEQKGKARNPKHRVVPILQVLRASIDATPSGHLTYIVTDHGRPFTHGGFGNWFKRRCVEAGLPHCAAHGLRKAGARRAAEAGATEHQLMALFGWTTTKQAGVYTMNADRKKLTSEAVGMLQSANKSPTLLPMVGEGVGKSAKKSL